MPLHNVFGEEAGKNYFSVSAMAFILEDVTLEALERAAGTVESDTGYGVSFAAGRKLGIGFRGEVECAFREAKLAESKLLVLDPVKIADNTNIHSMMFNVFYDIDIGHRFSPYFGVA